MIKILTIDGKIPWGNRPIVRGDPCQPIEADYVPPLLSETKLESMMPTRNAAVAAAPARKSAKKPAAKARAKVHKPNSSERPDGLRPGSKMSTMIDMALRAKGATEAEICAAIGWKKCRVTLKRTAEKAGYVLTQERNEAGEIVWKASKPAS